MTLNEHIAHLHRILAERKEARRLIVEKCQNETRTFDAEESKTFDELTDEITFIAEDVARLEKLEKDEMTTAKAPAVILNRQRDEDFEGQNFTRMTIAKALGKLDGISPIAIAERRWGKKNSDLVSVIKADVAGGGSGSGEWGSELVSADTYTGDFQEYLYGQTVYNKLPLREVPANITIKGQDGAATGYWVGESKAIPATSADFNEVTLSPLKVAALSIISKELMRDSSPAAEMLVRDALVNAAAQRIDTTFLSNSAAVVGSTPAGILYNISPTTSAGTDGDAVLNDIKEMVYRFIVAKNSGGQYLVMNPALASSLSLIRGALDTFLFPGLNETGGELLGRPVVTGDNVNTSHLIMLKPADIYRIGMGAMEVSISEHATIEMSDAPTGDTDTPTAPTGKTVSMFQTESMAIKVVQSINFARRRESAVAWINDAEYGSPVST